MSAPGPTSGWPGHAAAESLAHLCYQGQARGCPCQSSRPCSDRSPPAPAGGMTRTTPHDVGPPGRCGMAGVIPRACARGLLCARGLVSWTRNTSPPAPAGGMTRTTPYDVGPPGRCGMAGVIPLACVRRLYDGTLGRGLTPAGRPTSGTRAAVGGKAGRRASGPSGSKAPFARQRPPRPGRSDRAGAGRARRRRV
jgi:hypothetical protein